MFNSLLHRSQLKGGPTAGGGLQLGKVLEHLPNVRSYQGLAEMAAKLGAASVGGTGAAAAAGSGAIELPFELKALEVCLEMVSQRVWGWGSGSVLEFHNWFGSVSGLVGVSTMWDIHVW